MADPSNPTDDKWPYSEELHDPSLPPVPGGFTDHVYATKHGVQIELRVWRATEAAATTRPRGWMLWAHGGAFIMGEHYKPCVWLVPGLLARGVHIVSYSYRYTPHVGLADQVEDGRDALAWCREHLPALVDGDIDIDNYAVGGDSAGGLLALTNGLQLNPRPRAVLDVYGLGDMSVLPWEGLPTYRVPPASGRYSDEQVRAVVADRNPAHALTVAPGLDRYGYDPAGGDRDASHALALRRWAYSVRINLASPSSPPTYSGPYGENTASSVVYTQAMDIQLDVKAYLELRNQLFHTLLRTDSFPSEEAYRAYSREVSPLVRVETDRAAAQAFPPTFFLSGEADTVVPCSQSRRFAEVLRSVGVDTEEAYEPGVDHVFDLKYINPDVPGYETYIKPALDFVARHLS